MNSKPHDYGILFTFSVDRVVKKYGINPGKPGII
jgi:hypothetical protein